jgi:UDP-glucose 6-dehydrogenase
MTQIINHQSNSQKLTEIVKTLINNNSLYQENLNTADMIKVINDTFTAIAVLDINSISEQELTKRIKRILSLHLV